MNIFIEGPRWSGMWTECIAASLQQLGHRVECLYHNHKLPRDRLALALQGRLYGQARAAAWAARVRQRLLQRMGAGGWDVLFSIQGGIGPATLQTLRTRSPELRLIYWWGDVLSAAAEERIRAVAGSAERILVSYAGSHARLAGRYGEKVVYFPFGIAPAFHIPAAADERVRRRYADDVAFVGTCYPERCELLRYLNARLAAPVAVWGRGWRRCRGVRGRGALPLHAGQLVHACAKVSLNLHHTGSDGGGNMKYYEIPAAGGFQICDRQPVLAASAHGAYTVACRTRAEFLDRIQYYLARDGERRELARKAHTAALATACYAPRLAALLRGLN